MRYQVLQYVVGRALVDPVFEAVLLRSPERALAAIPLSVEERQVLTGTPFASLRTLANRIEKWTARPERSQSEGLPAPRSGSAFDGFDEFQDLAPADVVASAPQVLRKSA